MIIYVHIGACFVAITRSSGVSKKLIVAVAFGVSLRFVCTIGLAIGMFLWWIQIHNQQVFFDVNGMYAISLDNQFNNLVLSVRIEFCLSTILDCCVKYEKFSYFMMGYMTRYL